MVIEARSILTALEMSSLNTPLHRHWNNLQMFLIHHGLIFLLGEILCMKQTTRLCASAVYCARKKTKRKSHQGDGAS